MMHLLKCLTCLPFLLWVAPLIALQAATHPFWHDIQLHSTFGMKEDRYKVYISGMHPGRQDGEMEINGAPIDGRTIQSYLIRWHHAPSIYFERDKDALDQNAYASEAIFGFTGKGITLFTQLLLSKEFRQLRIGAGAGIRCSFLKELIGEWINSSAWYDAQNHANNLLYTPPRPYYFTWTPLIRLGFKLIENENYTLLIDGTWAPCIYTFSQLGKRYYWAYQRNVDLGGTWEKQLARYVNWHLRVAYGFCLNNEIVETYAPSSPDDLLYVSHYIGGIMAQVGISICIPVLRKCPIMGCHTKLDHTHSGKQYRGAGLFTGA